MSEMTFDDAMKICKAGKKVRASHHGPGWSIFYVKSGEAKGFYCLNPHTGSNYAFRPSEEDIKAIDWMVYQ